MSVTVFVIETGGYEQRFVFGVAASVEAAIAYIKAQYLRPYVVRWDLHSKCDTTTLIGHFEATPGYSTRHDAEFDITPTQLHALEDSR